MNPFKVSKRVLCGLMVGSCLCGQLVRSGAAPVITQQPAHQAGSVSSNAAFGVMATGVAPLGYQWLFEGVALTNGGRVSGTTSTNLTITNLNGGDAGWYRVVVSDSSGSVTSVLASLSVNLVTVDPSVAPAPNGYVESLAIQPDDKILVGGLFSSFSGQSRAALARLNVDGTFDATFNAGLTNAGVMRTAVQADGRIVVTGLITTAGGQSRSNIARINPNGSVDDGFAPTIARLSGYTIAGLAVQADGAILVGGAFVALNGQPRSGIGRFNADGTLDGGFNPGALGLSNPWRGITLQRDGKILIGGGFTNLAGQSRKYLGRLNADGTLDEGFNPAPMDYVGALAVQPDGKILANGSFSNAAGVVRSGLARLNPDGVLDTSFNVPVSDSIETIALQTDGKILIGGVFTNVAGLPRTAIARLNSDGSVDLKFNPVLTPYFGTYVSGIALQRDGKIVVGGQFASVEQQYRMGLVRLNNPDPATETLTHANNTITWLRGGASPEVWRVGFEQSTDGSTWSSLGNGARIPGGWQLTNVFPPGAASIRARGQVAGGDSSSGWFVQTYVGPPAALSEPVSRTNQANTTAMFSAAFSGSQPIGYRWLKNGSPISNGPTVSGATSPLLTLSNVFGADGGSYSLWATNDYGSRTSQVATLTVIDPIITLQTLGQIRDVGQSFTFAVNVVGTSPVYHWLKNGNPLVQGLSGSLVLPDVQASDAAGYRVIVSNAFGMVTSSVSTLTVNLAVLDTNFGINANGKVLALAPQADGKLLFGGDFTAITNQGIPVSRSRIARMTSEGTLDATFNPVAIGGVFSLGVQTDGRILAAGSFTNLAGQTHNRIGRLNADGSVDAGFNPTANSSVYVTAIQTNGAIIVGGGFTSLNGQTRNRIGRIYADGTLDTNFNPNANGTTVSSIVLQTDGRILVGGDFTTMGGQSRTRIARLNGDGSVDTSFNCFVNDSVYAMAVQADGKIVVGGKFTSLGGQARNWIGRLNTNGTTDLTFNPGAIGLESDILGVYSLAMQADGKIIVGGGFRNLGGQNTIHHLGRLEPAGAADLSFLPQFATANPNFSVAIYAVALEADGGIMAGGDFDSLSGSARNGLAKLHNSVPASETLTNPSGNIAWLRAGSGPEIWRTEFATSSNGNDWTDLGAGHRITNGWELAGGSIPENSVMRVRGYATGGSGNGSGWYIEGFSRPMILAGSTGVQSNWFGFPVMAGLGQTVVIDASTNLADWSPLRTNKVVMAPFYFNEPVGELPWRYYRARIE